MELAIHQRSDQLNGMLGQGPRALLDSGESAGRGLTRNPFHHIDR